MKMQISSPVQLDNSALLEVPPKEKPSCHSNMEFIILLMLLLLLLVLVVVGVGVGGVLMFYT